MPPFKVKSTGIFNEEKSTKTTCTLVCESYFDQALYQQPLNLRAWALQERLLAPRVVSFGQGEVF